MRNTTSVRRNEPRPKTQNSDLPGFAKRLGIQTQRGKGEAEYLGNAKKRGRSRPVACPTQLKTEDVADTNKKTSKRESL